MKIFIALVLVCLAHYSYCATTTAATTVAATTAGSNTTTAAASNATTTAAPIATGSSSTPVDCYVCVSVMVSGTDSCAREQTPSDAKLTCSSGQVCKVQRMDYGNNNVTYARSCSPACTDEENQGEYCQTAGSQKMCSKCCASNLCNSEVLTGTGGGNSAGGAVANIALFIFGAFLALV